MRALLALKFFFWGMAIFIVTTLMAAFHSLESWELRYIMPGFVRTFWNIPAKENSPVLILSLSSVPLSNEEYVRLCRSVVRDWKKSGAKAVLVPLPRNLPITPEVLGILKDIQDSQIAVLGEPPPSMFQRFYEVQSRGKSYDSWWIRDPVFDRAKVEWGVLSPLVDSYDGLFEFVPLGYKEEYGAEMILDVGLRMIQQYWNRTDSSFILRDAQNAILGATKIPLWGDGVSYAKFSFVTSNGEHSTAEYDDSRKSLRYVRWLRSVPDTVTALSIYKAKMVIIDWWQYPRLFLFWYSTYGYAYLNIIDAILNNQFVARYNEWDMAVIAMVIVFAFLMIFFMRTWLSVVILSIVAGGMLFLTNWMFHSLNVIYDPLYPMLTLVLCIIILPVVKLADEKRSLKEEVRSLQAQKQLLIDEVRETRSPELSK